LSYIKSEIESSLSRNHTVEKGPLGWQTKVTRSIHCELAVPERERAWCKTVLGKIFCPFPNFNALENQPAFA
jgi:hypothetical protein